MTEAFYYETDQTAFDTEAMTDSGDHKTYNSTKQILSNFTDADNDLDRSPVVRPDGVISGGTPSAGASDDQISVSAVSCFLGGLEYSSNDDADAAAISATSNVDITRGTAGNPYKKDIFIVSSAGEIDYVEGTPGTQYSTTRGTAGGPPYVPVGGEQLFELRYSSQTAAALTADNWKVGGDFTENAYPLPETKFVRVSNNALGYAGVEYSSALPTIHTGDVTKSVYISGYTPSFTELNLARNVVMPQDTASSSTETFYNGTKTSVSFSKSDGSFEFAPVDGVTDAIFNYVKKELWIKHYPDKVKTPYTMARGVLGATNDNPAEGVRIGSGTISALDGPYRITG